MGHRNQEDRLVLDAVDERVWKTMKQGSSDVFDYDFPRGWEL